MKGLLMGYLATGLGKVREAGSGLRQDYSSHRGRLPDKLGDIASQYYDDLKLRHMEVSEGLGQKEQVDGRDRCRQCDLSFYPSREQQSTAGYYYRNLYKPPENQRWERFSEMGETLQGQDDYQMDTLSQVPNHFFVPIRCAILRSYRAGKIGI
ncbi:hypothetical protein VM1G_11287 [Cytospora mali]|uniref:Uncharacterized protein n=1 Tax=Cytospora mali TaxID=578113 RepID=A0A194VMW9_CYTMA|nr:hypothetical protein VM1G_11287 [Valsa mali]